MSGARVERLPVVGEVWIRRAGGAEYVARVIDVSRAEAGVGVTTERVDATERRVTWSISVFLAHFTPASPFTEAEALAAPGDIYRHYKGGIYRVLLRRVRHTETKELGVVYEHLWPNPHSVYFRPESVFFGLLLDGSPRFAAVTTECEAS